MSPVIYWFRDDLRLHDNPALDKASQNGPVICVFILPEPGGEKQTGPLCQTDRLGGAGRVWLAQALKDLNRQLGGNLLVCTGPPLAVLQEIAANSGAGQLFITRRYSPEQRSEDAEITKSLNRKGITVTVCSGHLLWEPEEISKNDGSPYKVFTPFYRRGCLAASPPRHPLPAPKLEFAPHPVKSLPLDEWGLLSGRDWETAIAAHWDISTNGASRALSAFTGQHNADGLNNYAEGRNFPAKQAVSRLSPYLRFGQISAHQAWYEAAQNRRADDRQLDIFRSELGWREFSYSLLTFNPELKSVPLQARFSAFEWEDNHEHLLAWQRGLTGYPIVDAGMRELWQTGYMHNRVRMIVGSFLVKNLLLHWHHGEAWFWDCLFDADPASNTASWQWIAGCGADAAPYFRVFNPITQGQKFDPDGSYTRRFVPELAGLPDKYLFNPCEAPGLVLREAGIRLGDTYPAPIVDAKASRIRALDRFARLPRTAEHR